MNGNKCKHGMLDGANCAMCKDWPSLDRMRNMFPDLTDDVFMVMTPKERLAAMSTGVVKGLPRAAR